MSARAYLCILVELVGGDVVDGEDELDVVLLGLLNELLDLLGTSLIVEGCTDLLSDKVWRGLETPTLTLSRTFLKVKDIPPQMMRVLTWSNMFSMSWILSATLAPPRMARNGRSGFSRTLAKYSSSFFMRKPAARFGNSTPTMEE